MIRYIYKTITLRLTLKYISQDEEKRPGDLLISQDEEISSVTGNVENNSFARSAGVQ